MAYFGAKYPVFCRSGASEGVVLGKLVSANLTVNLATGELYADDILAEQASEFASGSLAMETDDMTDTVAAAVYGATVSDGAVLYKSTDSAPFGGLAYYKVVMKDGAKSWKAYHYPRTRAAVGNDNAQTKGGSIAFQTTGTTFTILEDEESGTWRETKTCMAEAMAVSRCNTWANIAPDSARLSGIRLYYFDGSGDLNLTPVFDPDVTEYTTRHNGEKTILVRAWAENWNASISCLAAAAGSPHTYSITEDGGCLVGSTGTVTLTFTVTNGNETKVYTVVSEAE